MNYRTETIERFLQFTLPNVLTIKIGIEIVLERTAFGPLEAEKMNVAFVAE